MFLFLTSCFRDSFLRRNVRENDCDDEDIHERDLKKEQPAEPHKLIVTEARQSKTHPNEKKQEHRHFREKDGDIEQAAYYAAPARCTSIHKCPVKPPMPCWNRQIPSTEKESHAEC